MANIITAGNSTNGGTSVTTDTSGTLNIVTGSGSGTTAITVDGSQNLSFNSGYGSAAVAYGCRAWVNFNGTGTVAIRASGNVTSITDNGTGNYTINFTSAMPDVNYSVFSNGQESAAGNRDGFYQVRGAGTFTTSAVQISGGVNNAYFVTDTPMVFISIFR